MNPPNQNSTCLPTVQAHSQSPFLPIEERLPSLCRISDLLPVLPIKRPTVWAWVKQGRFPQPIRPFGKFCTVWKREDILEWLQKARV
jgi:prophage regulatory protein